MQHHDARSLRTAAFAASLAFAAACGGRAPEAESGARPNLLLVVVDTLRADRLGCYGNPRPTSPHIDALAAQGFVFERAQSAAPWTAPALVTLMSGLYPEAHGVASFPDPPRANEGVTMLAELCSARGYATAAFTEGGYAKGDFGLDQGFDHYERQRGDGVSNVSNLHFPSRLAANVEKSIAWLQARAGEPFFLFFHTYEPHVPYAPDPTRLAQIGSSIDLAAEEARLRAVLAAWSAGEPPSGDDWLLLGRHRQHCNWVDAEPVARRAELEAALAARALDRPQDAASPLVPFVRDLYDAEVAEADAQLARLFEALDALDRARDTIVVIASDHGESLGEHGELGHGLLLSEVVLRMVLVVRAPMLAARPRRVEEVVSGVDLLPTLAELMQLEVGDLPLAGQSLVPLMRGEARDAPAFSGANTGVELRGRFRSVRSGRWRYLAQVDGAGRWLFDLQADPGETRDVRAENPETARELEAALLERAQEDERLRRLLPAEPLAPMPLDPDLTALGYVDPEEERD